MKTFFILLATVAAIILVGTVGGIDSMTTGQASICTLIGLLLLFGAWIGEAYRRVFSETRR